MGENLRQQFVVDVGRLRNLVVRYARGEASVKGGCDTLEGAVQEKLALLEGETEAGSQVAEVNPKTARILIIADDEMIRDPCSGGCWRSPDAVWRWPPTASWGCRFTEGNGGNGPRL